MSYLPLIPYRVVFLSEKFKNISILMFTSKKKFYLHLLHPYVSLNLFKISSNSPTPIPDYNIIFSPNPL